MIRSAAVAALAALVAGCAHPITRPQTEHLRLGTTTYDEVIRTYGDPGSDGSSFTVGLNGSTSIGLSMLGPTGKMLVYSFIERGFGFARNEVRTATYYFQADILVGHDYESSQAEETPELDSAKTTRITIGQTTRAQVLEIFGKPSGVLLLKARVAQRAPEFRGKPGSVVLLPELGGTPAFKYNLWQREIVDNIRFLQDTRRTLVVLFRWDDVVQDVVYREATSNY